MGLSESWLDKSVTDSEIAVPGFRMHRMDRTRRGGGVLVYVSEDVKSVRRQDIEEDGIEAVWIEARMKKTQVLLCNLYRPPDAKATWFDGLGFMLERVAQERLPVMILGDFNCDMLCSTSRSDRLSMIMAEYGLTQMIVGPTRVTQSSGTQIDLLYTSNTDLLRQVGCDEPGLSDHSLIYGVMSDQVGYQRPTFRTIRCFRNCDWERLLEDLDSAPWQVMETMEDMDDRWEYWKRLFDKIVASHVPTFRYSSLDESKKLLRYEG